jgi:hypothetical protein
LSLRGPQSGPVAFSAQQPSFLRLHVGALLGVGVEASWSNNSVNLDAGPELSLGEAAVFTPPVNVGATVPSE